MRVQKFLCCLLLLGCISLMACSDGGGDESGPNPNNSGSQNSGSSGGGSDDDYDRLNFNFTIGIELWDAYYYEGTYHYQIFLGWGVPYGTNERGISVFGIEVRPSDGLLRYNDDNFEDLVGAKKNSSWTYFYALLNGNYAQDWGVFFSIESKESSISLESRCKFWDDVNGKYFTGPNMDPETFYAN